ncbi:hypothetical protein C922_02129 [Plasmodium inui San Antonio 1]|uniref:Uncharacterized protein n=1 Tax=Plasmodium inui San Antonio 1 TaxID=1237626 RepID=W7A800_9APIC|nr:hypothetical protein C922_02129 [Plasmodium inui San Antonio 1]EUD67423.1 hypothetical protein C922_02129 [Plasmodium inui San Antonio 1]
MVFSVEVFFPKKGKKKKKNLRGGHNAIYNYVNEMGRVASCSPHAEQAEHTSQEAIIRITHNVNEEDEEDEEEQKEEKL